MGGTIISSHVFLSSCAFDRDSLDSENEFGPASINLMNEIADTIIPATDTPGARAAKVGEFMAMMLPEAYAEKEKKAVKDGLKKIEADFQDSYGKSFVDGSQAEKETCLKKLEHASAAYYETRRPEDPEHYYMLMKELTLLGYFTSEIGATQALRYVQTPGSYEACVPHQAGEKAWLW